jgi:hypothetical protein
VSRYDPRKNYEEAEANAIGTEFLRADLLLAEDAANTRRLLRGYIDQRIASIAVASSCRVALKRTDAERALVIRRAPDGGTAATHRVARPVGHDDVINASMPRATRRRRGGTAFRLPPGR